MQADAHKVASAYTQPFDDRRSRPPPMIRRTFTDAQGRQRNERRMPRRCFACNSEEHGIQQCPVFQKFLQTYQNTAMVLPPAQHMEPTSRNPNQQHPRPYPPSTRPHQPPPPQSAVRAIHDSALRSFPGPAIPSHATAALAASEDVSAINAQETIHTADTLNPVTEMAVVRAYVSDAQQPK